VTVECDDNIVLDKERTLTLYRVAQEALHNMRKHSRATSATLTLNINAPWVELALRDNGEGFVLSEVESRSFGLRSMRERLALVGGSLGIQASPGHGTTITARVPAS
jgi:signal transduction histidine kinase